MSQLQTVRGTRDLFQDANQRHRFIETTASRVVELYGFEEIQTPILEPAGLFKRGLGDTSDIVSKQMYLFKDLGGDELVLRPEGTAGVARAFIQEGMSQLTPLKLFYRGPMFRYERPQKGRYRQFHQFGVELLGVEKPQADLEVLACGYRILKELGVLGSITLHLNTIGDEASRAAYRDKLVGYLNTRKSELSQDSLWRLENNPLRILDSKDPGDKNVVASAPKLSDSLTPEAKAFFDAVLIGLKALEIPFIIDDNLVRGLDYYCHTVFEFTTDALGSQNAVLAGGRYDGLIKDLGGPQTPGVGWAFGIDRLAELLPDLPASPEPIAIVPLGDEAEQAAILLSEKLRSAGLKTDIGYSGNLAKRMKRADKIGARAAVIIGSNELTAGVAQVKWLKTGTQESIALSELSNRLLDTDN
ncbi:MAG: histidine--tRNA ligase [Bdellovibrionales bacterium]|nr:histidine--tRNA ligase [Bdellovibrionales bacterium]